MSEQAMDLRATAAALRRHRWILVVAAAIGALAGTLFVLVEPPGLGSTTLVLVPAPAASQANATDMSTQVRIARSATVLGKAGQAVTPALPARTVEDRVEVSSPTDQLIEITAFAASGAQAQALSQAVADAYVAYVRETARAITSGVLADLQGRASKLVDQVAALQKAIDATTVRQRSEPPDSVDARRDEQLMARLRAEQADISLQLDKVKDEVAASAPLGSRYGAGTSVVQTATAATGQPLWRPLVSWGSLGALAGVLLCALAVLVRQRRDPRVRLRDEIADAVGSPVLASVRSRPQGSVAEWSALLDTYEADPVEAWAFRQVLRALVPVDARPPGRRNESRPVAKVDHPRSLTVVSMAGDLRALAVGPQLAAFAASLGIVTRIVTSVGRDSAAPLWAAFAIDRRSGPRGGLLVGAGEDDDGVELTVVLAVADRRQPALGESRLTTGVLLAVAAGSATREELARLAVAVDDAGGRIDGIMVTDPDPSDHTTGLRTLEVRAREAALPTRLTGIGSSNVRPGDRGTSR